jgi:hypothetical protein
MMMKSSRIIWAGHIAHVGEVRIAYAFLLENLKGSDHAEDLDVNGKWEYNIRMELTEIVWEGVD